MPGFTRDAFGFPIDTATGVRCANHNPDNQTRHENADAVRECFRFTYELDAAAEADHAAELAVERWFEDRGYDEARAQEDHEARMGVVPFHEAMAAAADAFAAA